MKNPQRLTVGGFEDHWGLDQEAEILMVNRFLGRKLKRLISTKGQNRTDA